MGISRRARLPLFFIAVAALALAISAVSLAVTFGDPVSPLFAHVLTIPVIAALVIWFALAWAARRATIGDLPKESVNSWAAFVWGGSRVALLLATVLVTVGWLITLALGLELATDFVRALVLLLVVTAFTGIAGGAFLNSVWAMRHWRRT